MKRTIKMTILLVVIVSMISSLFIGCTNENDGSAKKVEVSSNKEENATTTEEGTEMEAVKYTVMIKQGIADYPPDGGIAKEWLLDAWESDLGITNTDYEVLIVPGSDYNTKLNAMLASGDIPDYFDINIDELQLYVDNGMIAPIDELVEQMPAYKELISTVAGQISYDNFMVDGKHYGFVSPSLPGALNEQGVEGLVLRTDWLENLDMEVPTTLDELHDVLYAFTYDDPDGNGADDTYGFGGDRDRMFATVFGAYGIYLNGLNSWVEVDGEFVHATVMPGAKEALAVLQQWYSEGIIDPDKFVIQAKQSKDKLTGGKFGAMETTVWWAHGAREAWAAGEGGNCAFIAPVKGPEGYFGYPVSPVSTNARVMSQELMDEKDPERFAEIMNLMVSDSPNGARLVQYGIEGEYYEYDEANDSIIEKKIDDTKYSLGYSNPIRWIKLTDRRWIPVDDPRKADFDISNNHDNWLLSSFYGSVPAMKDYPDLYSKLWLEYFTKIVTGTDSVDEWDVYVEKFYQQGGQELTDQVNSAK